ncbi:MAG: T9SS type A sorting domain-containing protein [Bacteroidota bacterium]
MKRELLVLIMILAAFASNAQTYLSERVGSNTDLDVEPDFGLCLMGGAGESDEAMTWFLEKANGGDVLVIRANGIGGYNNYMFSELGVTLNSVETISFEDEDAATDPYVLHRLAEAEAIWMAGGNQAIYTSYWKDTPVMDAINNLLNVRGGALGGISAGMAILGEAYFPASLGSLSSEDVLEDPLDNSVLIGYDDFIDAPFMEETITETHFNDPDRIRYGRIMGFMARLKSDQGFRPKAIASNEYCSVTIDDQGIARAWGEFPEFDDDYLYFLQENVADQAGPEVLEQDVPLTWVRSEQAVKVYKVPGTVNGNNTFDLNTWTSGSGGDWEDWWVDNGELFMASGDPLSVNESSKDEISIYPNPSTDFLNLPLELTTRDRYEVFSAAGNLAQSGNFKEGGRLDISSLPEGFYTIRISNESEVFTSRFVKIQ